MPPIESGCCRPAWRRWRSRRAHPTTGIASWAARGSSSGSSASAPRRPTRSSPRSWASRPARSRSARANGWAHGSSAAVLRRGAMRRLLTRVVALVVAAIVLNEVRRPSRWIGRFFAWSMNQSHSPLTGWGLTHVPIEKSFTILDVGCGGGRTIARLAERATEGKVYGIDYADGSVAVARATNAKAIAAGRGDVRHAPGAPPP